MSTHPAPASGRATALSKPVCNGEQCQCADRRLFFPGGALWCFPHGNICDGCKDERQDKGLESEAFGTSPRQVTPPLSRTAALPMSPTSEPQGSNRA